MLTRLRVHDFKALDEIDIELGQAVVLIGPNNSGKTSALQALSLWQNGVAEWARRRSADSRVDRRPGVTLNRRDLTHTPVRDTRLLWRDRKVMRGDQRIYMNVIVNGQDASGQWECGLEFYYSNSESIYCRPMLRENETGRGRIEIAEGARSSRIALLPPMSGLVSEEAELQPGRIDTLIGEGRTAEVLRNLCLRVCESDAHKWESIRERIETVFGVQLDRPERDGATGTVDISYRERDVRLDIGSAGRGLQQTLLLLAHMYANPGAVLLLDEPDAHLEVLRQREIYNLLVEGSQDTSGQIIAASHSEILLNEAADRDVVIAFVGRPHRMNDRGAQVRKALREIGYDQSYQARVKGCVLYLEGATDLAFLRAFASLLNHPAQEVLRDPFVRYVANQPMLARNHFFGLREAQPDLRACAVFDRIENGLPLGPSYVEIMWSRYEVENYVTSRAVLLRFAEARYDADDLVENIHRQKSLEAMTNAIDDVERASNVLGIDLWSVNVKASEQVLPTIFRRYFGALKLVNEMDKADFHQLVQYLRPDEIASEVRGVLDVVAENLMPEQ